ncbi:MAG: SLOG family protein [Acutalibacteraceae bacterium]|nr:SLOG family protein [Acutalibacteraceae bacterium]
MEKTATFIGHGECWGVDKEKVRAAAEELIQKDVETFLSGGMGGFDWLGARVVYELKEKYPHIKNILVIPYLTFNVRNKDLFDEILYPDGFEKYHFKAAIPKRNRFLVDNSKYAICYVTHGWGGAAQTYEYAKKHGLNIVDIRC